MFQTAKGSGWSMMISQLARYYHLSDPWVLRRIDEMQVANRLSDLPKLLAMERRHLGLAIWGPAKKEDSTERKKRGRR